MSKIIVKLTLAQINALIDAANAMLAGPEGEGDAVGVSFAVLNRAVDALATQTAKRGRRGRPGLDVE